MLKWIKKKISIFAADIQGTTPIEMAVVFAVIAVTATVILGPMIANTGDQVALNRSGNIDRVVTGSIAKSGSKERYTLRRSVLQSSRQARCIIYADGNSEGDC